MSDRLPLWRGLAAMLVATTAMALLEAAVLPEPTVAAVLWTWLALLAVGAAGTPVLVLLAGWMRSGPQSAIDRLGLLPVLVGVFWVGSALSTGTGITRAGLGVFVLIGVPLVFVLTAFAVRHHGRKLLGGRPRLAAAVWIAGAITARYVNRTVLVGLYDEVHAFLFGIELLAWAGAVACLVPLGRVAAGVAAAGLAAGVLALFATPPEDVRSMLGREGFHGRRLMGLYGFWREPAELRFEEDRALLERWRGWTDVAAGITGELDARLPGRRDMNVLVITVDTLRADRVGARPSLTPTIDAVAARGTTFTRAWAQYPSTHLSSASFFLGRYPTATPLYRSFEGTTDDGDRTPLLPELARRNGMTTAAAIAFTVDWMGSATFQEMLAPFEAVNPDRPHATDTAGDVIAHCAKAALDGAGGRRFFLWFHLFEPHHPYTHHAGITRGDDAEARYDGEVTYADRQVADVLAHLEKLGLTEKTVVVIHSDHGEAFGEHRGYYHGSSLYDEQLRIPLVIRVPGLEPSVVDEPVENVDVYATLQDLLGFTERAETQGTSLVPLMIGVGADRFPGFAYGELPSDVKELSAGSSNVAMYSDGRWKLIYHFDRRYSELYDLEADPTEQKDLAAELPDVKRRMLNALLTVRRETSRFGRTRDLAAIERERVEQARALLASPDPFTRQAGVGMAMTHGLEAMSGDLIAIAGAAEEFPELRLPALRVASRWDVPGVMAVADRMVDDANPVLAWAAMRLMFDLRGEVLNARLEKHLDGPLPLRREALMNLVRQGDEDLDRVARLNRLAGQWDSGGDVPRRAVIAHALGSRVSGYQTVHQGRYLHGRGWTPDELVLLLEEQFEKRPTDWVRQARELARDRYVAPAVRDRILERAVGIDPAVGQEVAMPLLAGWDPAFHARAVRLMSEAWGDDAVEALERAWREATDVEDLFRAGEWRRVVEACERALAGLPGLGGAHPLRLAATRAAAALGDGEAVRRHVAAMHDEAMRTGAQSRVRMLGGRLQEIRELGAARLEDGPLPEDAAFYVTDCEALEGDGTTWLPRQVMVRRVRLESKEERTLLGGAWPLSGRLRVIWRRIDADEDVYGTEVELEGDLASGDVPSQLFAMEAPAGPGRWLGRVIIHQQGGPRFHVVEDDRATFEIDVVDPTGPPVERTWTAAPFRAQWAHDAGVEAMHLDRKEGRLEAVMTGYRGGFTGPPIRLDREARTMKVDAAWLSSLPGAEVLRLGLLGPDGEAVHTLERPLRRDGVRATVEVALPPVDGVFVPRLEIGERQGILLLHSVTIR